MSLETEITNFRLELEDLVKALVLRWYFDDSEVENPYTPYVDDTDAITNIGTNWRPYMTVNVNGVEKWFLPNGDLVSKVGTLTLADKIVTLAKMADVASGTVFYRKTAGTGSPEVQTLATLAADLGLTDLSTTLAGFVLKEVGKSLVADTDIAKIHEPGSDDQDLSGLVEKAEGFRLISEEEAAQIKQDVFTITLPSSASVGGRCSSAVEGVDFPTGWTIAADTNPIDLKITHGLERRIAQVTVFSVDGTEERLLMGNAAYSGVFSPTNNEIVIESLATILAPIVIHLILA